VVHFEVELGGDDMNPQFDPSQMGALMAAYTGLIVGAMVFGLLISVLICYLVYNLYLSIPAEKRELDPVKVWFLLIPCVPLVFNFFVFPGLARSMRAALAAQGVTVEETLEKLGLWYSITTCCCLIPCVGYVAGPASLVLLIIFLIKGYDQKKQLA
jgi:hypothetical protein